MNRLLLNPFQATTPQSIVETFEGLYMTCCSFHQMGHSLAAGCSDGKVIVWDMDTRAVIRRLSGHSEGVTCLKWFGKTSILASAGREGKVIVWDVTKGLELWNVSLPSIVIGLLFHQFDKNIILTFPLNARPCVLKNGKVVEMENLPISQGEESYYSGGFNEDGSLIVLAHTNGEAFVLDVDELEILHRSVLLQGVIKQLVTYKKVSVASQISRVTFEDVRKSSIVNKLQWNQICFSGDGEMVVAGTAAKALHNIYIWDKSSGNLAKILEGPREGLLDVTWHPFKPTIASLSSYGVIYIWTCPTEENWSAFAPDFEELEDNIEYQEKEDEFDIVPESEKKRNKEDEQEIDIISPWMDEGKDTLWYLCLESLEE